MPPSLLTSRVLSLSPARVYERQYLGPPNQYLVVEFRPGSTVAVTLEQRWKRRPAVARTNFYYGQVEEDSIYLTHGTSDGEIILHFSTNKDDLPGLGEVSVLDETRRFFDPLNYPIAAGGVQIVPLITLSAAEWQSCKEITVHILSDCAGGNRDLVGALAVQKTAAPLTWCTIGNYLIGGILGQLSTGLGVGDAAILGAGYGIGGTITVPSPGVQPTLVLHNYGVGLVNVQIFYVARF